MPSTTITIDKNDKRDVAALKLFQDAGTWAKCWVTLEGGRKVKAYGIPSRSEPSVYRLANLRQCSCQDFLFRQDGHGGFRCAHMRAVKWYVDYVAQQKRRQIAREAHEASLREEEAAREAKAERDYRAAQAVGVDDAF